MYETQTYDLFQREMTWFSVYEVQRSMLLCNIRRQTTQRGGQILANTRQDAREKQYLPPLLIPYNSSQ